MWLFRQPKRPISDAERHSREALRYRNRKKKSFDLGLAVWHFKQAIKLEPNNPFFHYQLGRAYAAVPLLAITRGVGGSVRIRESAELAIAEAKEALRLKPDYAEAYLVLGEAYMYLGDAAKASQAFEAVLDLPGNAKLRVYAERESLQVAQGINTDPDPEKARKCLERAVTHRNRGEYRRAERELNKALKLAPDWPWMYDSLCRLGG